MRKSRDDEGHVWFFFRFCCISVFSRTDGLTLAGWRRFSIFLARVAENRSRMYTYRPVAAVHDGFKIAPIYT